jgi:hypothetical protein
LVICELPEGPHSFLQMSVRKSSVCGFIFQPGQY